LAVVATMVLAAVTSGIALAGELRGSGDDAPVAQQAWLTSPAAIMAEPEAPLAPPEPAPNNVVVLAAPDTGAQLALPAASQPTLPAAGESSTVADDEPQSSGPVGNVAQRAQDRPLDANNPVPVRITNNPGNNRASEGDPSAAEPTQGAAPPAVDPECRPADSRLGVKVLLDDADRVRRIEISGFDVPCVDVPIHLILDMRGDALDISATIKVSKDRVIVFKPEKPFFPREVQGITVKPA